MLSTVDIPRLAIIVHPALGENVNGYVRRIAEANGHLTMLHFVRAMGLGHGFGPTSSDHGWECLSRATGLSYQNLAVMRWTATGSSRSGSRVVIAGVRTLRSFAVAGETCLCVACLRETGIRRDFWSLTAVAACPRHKTLLVTTCVCGKPLLPGIAGRTMGCQCGADLDDLVTIPAPRAVVRVASNLAARVGGVSGYACENDLPPPFNNLNAHDYMALVHTLGIAATTPPEEDRFVARAMGTYGTQAVRTEPSFSNALARVNAAASIIDDWPKAYSELLRNIEGRNPNTNRATLAGAFATAVGRMLASPIRDVEGVPMRLLCQAIDEYWSARQSAKSSQRRGLRRLTSLDATAQRLRGRVNSTSLAMATGTKRPTPFLTRILRATFDRLSEDERCLSDNTLARIVTEKAIALHGTATSALSSEAAKAVLEGGTSAIRLCGWEHPRLLPADPALHGLLQTGQSAYASAAVQAALARLRGVVLKTERDDGLAPLVSVGLRGHLRPWYTKTDVLLELFEGRLTAYSTVSDPKLVDVLVKLDSLRRAECARSPANLPTCDGFATPVRINTVLQGRFGVEGRLTPNEIRRLARASFVRRKSEFLPTGGNGSAKPTVVYDLEQVVCFVARRLKPGGLPTAEAAAFGRLEDIGADLLALRHSGMGLPRIAAKLNARGVRTPDGALWRHKALIPALLRAETGIEVLGLLTGESFAKHAKIL